MARKVPGLKAAILSSPAVDVTEQPNSLKVLLGRMFVGIVPSASVDHGLGTHPWA